MRHIILCALAALTLSAHHSVDAVYDRAKQADFRATVTKVEWLNPHAHFWADIVMDGHTVNWEFELGSPNRLIKNGWSRYTLKQGDHITVTALPARNGSARAAATSVAWPDGHRMANFDLFDQ